MKQVLLKSLFLLSLTFISCGEDDSAPLGEYENGVFVVNEGNFLEGDGSVTYFGRNTETVEQGVFSGANGNQLGDVVQSATFHNGLTYLVVNNSNKVEVVNAYTFDSEMTISDVLLPRYMDADGNTGYLTEWVSFSDRGRVSIIDLSTGIVSSTIEVGFGAEDIEVVGTKGFVTNSFETTLSIIDFANDNAVEAVELSSGPKQIILDKNNDLWVACAGGFDQDFNPLNNGAIHKVSSATGEVLVTYELNTNFSGKLAIDASGGTVYFYIGNAVFSQNVDTEAISSEPIIIVSDATSVYGIGVDPTTGVIYVADSKFFQEDGEVFRYQSDGTFIDSFVAGRGPNGFAFN